MFKISIGSNTKRKSILIDPKTDTPETLFVAQGISLSSATVTIDGNPITKAQYDTPLNQLGINEGSFLIATPKLDSGC